MDNFEYKPIDLEDRSFRLVRLIGGHGRVQCEVFHASHDTKDDMEYEALSYTWGSIDKPQELEVNGKNLSITDNLALALQHLRHQHQDRILWIDAICIDQSNCDERQHQVRQMTDIYRRAKQVIIWLGESTAGTDLVFLYMHKLEEQTIDHACNSWSATDKRWKFLWSNVQLILRNVSDKNLMPQRDGFEILLRRSWFKRVWILQEVANAQAAKIMCGTKSVSARIFAIVPPLLDITPDEHCQAVLDIMPGPSRRHSWWTQNRDLQTLLLKFQASEASDSRDNIYALLSISSDAHDYKTLVPDYKKPVKKVIQDTVAFLLATHNQNITLPHLPQWTLPRLLKNLRSLENAVLIWAAQNAHEMVVKLLLDSGKVNVNSRDRYGSTALCWAAGNGHKAIVKLLLKTDKVNTDLKNYYGQTPLSQAAANGCKPIVELLLNTGKVDINSKDKNGLTPLWRAMRNDHVATIKPLLETDKVDVKAKDEYGRMPLWWAFDTGNETVVKLLLASKVDIDTKDRYGQTSLSWAARKGYTGRVKLLLNTGKVDINSKDIDGWTPLSWAAEERHKSIVELLLNTRKADINSRDIEGWTPLWWAARNGHEAVV